MFAHSVSSIFPTHFLAAAGGDHGVPVSAETLVGFVSNSIFVGVLVTGVIWYLCRRATKNATLIPSGIQNGVEFVMEFLYDQVEQIVGKEVAPRAFPLLATVFIYVLTANWLGLVPGVGTIGFGTPETKMAYLGLSELPQTPILRPATADLNLTLGLAACAMIVWFWITMRVSGPVEFIKHLFAPKGGFTGAMGIAMAFIFFFVGIIEVISILFRPISLSMRLFGNIFAGENLLHTMASMGEKWGVFGSFFSSIVLPFPFFLMELLVGLLQAMVFALLCAVYIQLSTAHEEGH